MNVALAYKTEQHVQKVNFIAHHRCNLRWHGNTCPNNFIGLGNAPIIGRRQAKVFQFQPAKCTKTHLTLNSKFFFWGNAPKTPSGRIRIRA